MSSNSWVGFPEVAEHTEGVITVGYTGMPQGLDPESLQLNVKALNRGVIGWGGYAALTLAAYKGDEDQLNIGIGDADGSGAGTATGAASITRAESSQLHNMSDAKKNKEDIRNGTLGIQWNIAALNSRIEVHQQYEPHVRARQLDKIIRREAARGVWRHNTSDVVDDTGYIVSAGAALCDLTIHTFLLETPQAALSGRYSDLAIRLGIFASFILGPMRGIRAWAADAYPRDFIPDPFMGTARPTRAMIGAGVLGSSRLVRATPTKVQ